MTIDWAYMRRGCVACDKAWKSLTKRQISIDMETNARRESFDSDDAWRIVREADKVYVASGKKVLEFVPATADRAKMIRKITGPTGKLRAPTLRRGRVFYVGFNERMYDSL